MENSNNTQPQVTRNAADDEIDLIELAKTLWNGRGTILRYVVAGAVLGVLVALVSPNKFTASTTIVPQSANSQSSKLGGLSSLAAMAGFNLNNMGSSESLSPLMYPRIIKSLPFQLELMNSTFHCPGVEQPVSLYEFYTDHQKAGIGSVVIKYTLGLPGVIIKALRGSAPTADDQLSSAQLLSLTEDQEKVRKILDEQISLELNDKEGYLSLSTTFGDARLAAEVAQKAQTMLQDYITRYKIEKAATQLNFIQDRYNEKKTEFEEAQKKLALFRDRNKNVSTAMAQTEEEQLLSQYNIAYSVYSELAKQLEQAQIQVKEDTPVLTVIDPVRIPTEKSAPKRSLILIVWIFLGGIIGTGVVFGKEFMGSVKKRWLEVN